MLQAELVICGRAVPLSEPVLVGIVNVTPDSFSDGGRHFSAAAAHDHGLRLLDEGAHWLDIGGESTRPGATPVDVDEELRRVMPIVESLARSTTAILSIDTYKPTVARRAIAAGAAVVNDITGFRDPAMIDVAANTAVGCVVMHMRGTPQTMASLSDYGDVVTEIRSCFLDRLDQLQAAGIDPRRVMLDPGFGFAKKRRHGLEVLRRMEELVALGRPVMVGTSRKSMLGELTGRDETARVHATVTTTLAAYARGARIFRVHDVAATRDALAVWRAIEGN